MNETTQKIFKTAFLFSILGISGYLMWKLFSPFFAALILAAIIAVICHPLYERIVRKLPNHNTSLGALIALLVVVFVIITPLSILGSFVLREALSIYTIINSSHHLSIMESIAQIEALIQSLIPGFSLDIGSVVQQSASFIANNLVSIFTNTASTIFLLLITLLATYYFFKDGKYFTTYLMHLSPLSNEDDMHILARLAVAIRSVILGTVSVALIQGVLTAIGLTIFGFDRAILWGCIAAIGALIPAVGTTLVFVPAVIFLLYSGSHFAALALSIWGILAVGLVDNLIGPYLMGKKNKVHPFLMLLSVLGGIGLFGPIGFILGPVILTLFLVLLELYHQHMKYGD